MSPRICSVLLMQPCTVSKARVSTTTNSFPEYVYTKSGTEMYIQTILSKIQSVNKA